MQIHAHLAETSARSRLELGEKTGLSAALTCGGAVFLKKIKLHRSHFSDITKDVVAAARVCFNSAAARYFWGASLCLSNPQEAENGSRFLKLAPK